jgi:hypothetical protein
VLDRATAQHIASVLDPNFCNKLTVDTGMYYLVSGCVDGCDRPVNTKFESSLCCHSLPFITNVRHVKSIYWRDLISRSGNQRKASKRVFTVCKDYGLNVSLDKYEVMKISHKTVLMKKIKCNEHEMKEVKRCNYLGSKIIGEN